MSEQILTQNEVDALLKGLSNGDIKTESEKNEIHEDVKRYDFLNQEKVVRGRMPTLDLLNEKFSRNLRSSVFNILRRSVDISAESVTSMRYEEFQKNLQLPSSLNICQLTPLRGQGVLVLDPNLVFFIVDSYFGGDGRFHARIEGREFTAVEQGVIRKVVDVISEELRAVWKPVQAIDFSITRTEMNPHFINIIGNSELVVICTFNMEIEAVSNKFFLCLPYASLEPIHAKLAGTGQHTGHKSDEAWKRDLLEQFCEVPLTLTGELGSAKIHVSDMLNLKVGDVIQLDKKSKGNIEVCIEGVPKYEAKAGLYDNNYSFKILSVVNERGKYV